MRGVVVLLLVSAVFAKHEQYIGYKSYVISPSTEPQIKGFYSIADQYEVDVLQRPILQRGGLVLVKPERQESFLKALEDLNVQYQVYVEDVKAQLDNEDQLIEAQRNQSFSRNGGRQLPYDSYQDLETINAYLEDIARRFPQRVTLESPANTFEGRPIYIVKISTTNFQVASKPVIVIDAGIHSREWITIPTATWAIKKLVEDVTEPDLLDRFDWIIIPVVNPDGYRFTFTNRFWRKTRSTDQHSLSQICPGVDGNRNYDFHWGTTGVSSTPCSDIFPGGRSFSEVETRVVRDVLQQHLPRIALYLTMHSFGSMILYPWGHDGSLPANAFNLHVVGVAMAQAIDAMKISYFPNYVVGNSAVVLNYAASGAAEDYAHSIGVPLSYTYELPGLGFGMNGFIVAPQYIEQICRETWAGVVVGARRAGDMFNGPIVP